MVGLLEFGAGTYEFVPVLLKFLLVGKLLFYFMYSGGLNPSLAAISEGPRPIFASINVLLLQLSMFIENPSFV